MRRFPTVPFLAVQGLVVTALAVAYAGTSSDLRVRLSEEITRTKAYEEIPITRDVAPQIAPLYNDPTVVSDENLARVLAQILPRFPRQRVRPNYVEHALRAWGVHATFKDPEVMSGEQMKEIVLNNGRFVGTWDTQIEPLLTSGPGGVDVRWGMYHEASAHHDHLIASLSEAGVTLHEPVYPAGGGPTTLNAILQQAIHDFDLDEREVEWSAMAFALWLPPTTTWKNAAGRELSFDKIARRLIRGHKEYGVCLGTHRVYSLMLMWRLNKESGGKLLSPQVADEAYAFLKDVRDLIAASQMDDGRWPQNWWDGARALEKMEPQEEHQQVIATGHHLEWLAIAPKELHPPHEQICKAADWLVKNITSKSVAEVQEVYTFYSHVGNALALWRGTHPAEFWKQWEGRVPPPETPAAPPAGDAVIPPPPPALPPSPTLPPAPEL